MIRQIILNKVIDAINISINNSSLGELKEFQQNGLIIEKTRNPEFGDFAVNVSPFAKFAKLPPVKIAETVASNFKLKDVEVTVVNGFINFKLGTTWLNNIIKSIVHDKLNYGKSEEGKGQKVLVEYVSANPTGPLHIGHGRWAAVGSALSNLLKFAGYTVDQEFYINDAGNQVNNLGKSLWLRILQELGNDAKFPETVEEGSKNYYPGLYLIDIAKKYLAENPKRAEQLYSENPDPYKPSEELVKELSGFAKKLLLEEQKTLLHNFKVDFDFWTSESSIHEKNEVEATIEKLKSLGKIYEKEDAVWFKSSEYGDDQDRVIIKTDGAYTYLTADIAYHHEKIKRGYDKLINIWGADHHGYVPRMKAAIAALGHDSNSLEVLLGQLVNLIVSGEQVRMGKRKKMLTLEDLITEVGIDATRYWMIMRNIDNTLDFDVELAKSCSDENPVYYVQYAHARASGILRTASSQRVDQDYKAVNAPFITKEELDRLINEDIMNSEFLQTLWTTSDEKEFESSRALVLKLGMFKDVIASAAKQRTPYQITKYLQELAGDFHYFYTFCRVLNVEESLMKARLLLVSSTRQIMANGLAVLGVNAPDIM